MRNLIFSEDEYYHVCSRGIGKQRLFYDQGDYWRFLFLILYFQSTVTFVKVGKAVKQFVQHRMLDRVVEKEVISKKQVELVAFCIMPNHFHLILKELGQGNISKYIQRILNSYGKYHNAKYEKSGHALQGKFRAVHVETNEQLLYLSAYIHRNPSELPGWKGKEKEYFWSSHYDYCVNNRWGELLKPEIVLEQFKSKEEYEDFVSTHPSKSLENKIGELTLD